MISRAVAATRVRKVLQRNEIEFHFPFYFRSIHVLEIPTDRWIVYPYFISSFLKFINWI